MENWTRLSAGLAASIIFLGGTALAPDKPAGCDKGSAPEKVEGQVIKIDPEQGKLTLRGPNGDSYEFQTSKEALQDFKVGDRVEAKLRSNPNCKQSAS